MLNIFWKLNCSKAFNLQLRRCNLTNDAATHHLHQAATLLVAPRMYVPQGWRLLCVQRRRSAGRDPVASPWSPTSLTILTSDLLTSTKQFPSPLAHWIFFTYREPFCVNPQDQPPSPPLRVTSRRPQAAAVDRLIGLFVQTSNFELLSS